MEQNKYNQCIEDIDNLFSLLRFVDLVETYKSPVLSLSNRPETFILNSTQQKCMRSNAILMLYNLIESTVSECFLSIFDAIYDEHIKYDDLIDSLRDLWIKSNLSKDDSISGRIKKTRELFGYLNSDIVFSDDIGRFNGNVDLRCILNECKIFKIRLGSIPDKEIVSVTLKAIKDARNHLAHGDITFSDFGSTVLLSDILKYKTCVIAFLSFFRTKVEEYISEKKYKKN